MSTRPVSIAPARIARREFLKFSVAASGGLLIGFYSPGTGSQASAQESASAFMPNAFVRIGTDEQVTVIVNHSEMGQGVYTSLPMLLAEELDADWSKIGFESAPVDPKYNHPVFGMQITGEALACGPALSSSDRPAPPRAPCWSQQPRNDGILIPLPVAPSPARSLTVPTAS